jgi:hypothetical protein
MGAMMHKQCFSVSNEATYPLAEELDKLFDCPFGRKDANGNHFGYWETSDAAIQFQDANPTRVIIESPVPEATKIIASIVGACISYVENRINFKEYLK